MSTGSETEESVVQRWSRRKLSRATGADAAAAERSPDATSAQLSVTAEHPDRILTDADMPSVQTLDHRSDVSAFFSPGVSQALRRLALRKVFHLPSFNVRDGLDDYDDDFTRFAALGNTMTADLRHRLEMEAKRKQEAELAKSDADTEASPTHGTEVGPPDTVGEMDDQAPAAESAAELERRQLADRELGMPPNSSQA